MSSSPIPNISAIRRIITHTPSPSIIVLTNWTIEENLSSLLSPSTHPHPHSHSHSHSHSHPHFNSRTGIYTIPKDGIYLIKVQIISIGGPTLCNAQKTRNQVKYVLRIEDPKLDDHYLDIGCHHLGIMQHLRVGTKLTCLILPGVSCCECIRMEVCCIQRKRKQEEKSISKKERKRWKRAAKRVIKLQRHDSDDDIEAGNDKDWEQGFESDSSSEESPTSAGSTDRLPNGLNTSDEDRARTSCCLR